MRGSEDGGKMERTRNILNIPRRDMSIMFLGSACSSSKDSCNELDECDIMRESNGGLGIITNDLVGNIRGNNVITRRIANTGSDRECVLNSRHCALNILTMHDQTIELGDEEREDENNGSKIPEMRDKQLMNNILDY